MALGLDKRVVAEGALLALAITVPPLVLVRIVGGDEARGDESNVWVVAVLTVFIGYAMGGHRAAKKRPRNGLAHAAAAAGLAFAASAAFSLVRRAVTGEAITVSNVISLMLLGTITVSLGVLGGYVALRRAQA